MLLPDRSWIRRCAGVPLVAVVATATAAVAGWAIGASSVVDAGIEDASPSVFVAIDSYRTFDSRVDPWSNKLSSVGVQEFHPGYDTATGTGANIPNDAVAVSYNLTVTDTEGAGFVTLDTLPLTDPTTSDINWAGPGLAVANGGITTVTIGDDGSPTLGILLGGTDDVRAHVIIDINGYFVEP